MFCPGGRGDDKGYGGACVIGCFSVESIPVATQLLPVLRGLKILWSQVRVLPGPFWRTRTTTLPCSSVAGCEQWPFNRL